MLLVDRSTAGVCEETPNFNTGRMNIHEAERKQWHLVTAKFIKEVYAVVLETVGVVFRSPSRNKAIERVVSQTIQTVLIALNNCLLKKNVEAIGSLLSTLCIVPT